MRQGDFHLYNTVLKMLLPFVFIFDRVNYARWLSVHVHELSTLRDVHPDVYAEFVRGNFVVQKSNRKFSTIGLDHAHEQSNKILKQTVHGLNCDVQNLWTHAAPEIASILTQKDPVDIAPHHEDNASHDAMFFNDIKKLQARINECCNPFKDSDTLIKLNSRAEISHADQCNHSIRSLENRGKELYEEFYQSRLLQFTRPLSEKIVVQKVLLPRFCETAEKLSFMSPKDEASFLGSMCSVLTARKQAVLEALEFEVLNTPPTFVRSGKLHFGQKSRLMDAFRKAGSTVSWPQAGDALVVDLSHIVMSTSASTFAELFNKVWQKICQHGHYARIDIVCDNYKDCNELKGATHSARGCDGTQLVFSPESLIPPNFHSEFMRNNINKAELYSQLTKFIYENSLCIKDTQIHISIEGSVLSNMHSNIEPCQHSEADTKCIYHAIDLIRKNYKCVIVRGNDTDMLILLCSFHNFFKSLNPLYKIFVYTGKYCFNLHEIVSYITPQRTQGLKLLYALSGIKTFIRSDFTYYIFIFW